MRALLWLVVACSSPKPVSPDAAVPVDAGLDAPAIGAECQPLDPPPTPCGSAGYCSLDLAGSGYHCRGFCASPDTGGCPAGYQAVYSSPGYGCLCYPK